jgi:hypothetical protein
MKPALTTVSLIILGLGCGVQAKAQDSKTEPAPRYHRQCGVAWLAGQAIRSHARTAKRSMK